MRPTPTSTSTSDATKLQVGEAYNTLAERGREHIEGGIDDSLFQPIYGEPEWLTFLDTTNGCFVEDPSVSPTVTFQKYA